MTVLKNGNIGIGVTNPQNKLEVCGQIHAKEVVIETTSWCDFKLKPTYKRMTWQEKLLHIHTFGYLPEMDSGAEIETNGLKIAKNLRGIIWNIEDNTMDIIDLQKENEQQKEKNSELQKQIDGLKKVIEQMKQKK